MTDATITAYLVGWFLTFLYLLTCYGVGRPKAAAWICALTALLWPYTVLKHLYGYWSNLR